MSVLFFKPIARKALWGKTLVRDYFNYNDFPDGVGQAWAFSGQKDNSTVCKSEPYVGKTLYELWHNNKELFGNKTGEFPLIISLVAPQEDLSIQVHPNEEYAKKIGYESGKNEAWYFIESAKNASIVYGHIAKNKDDIYKYINNEEWDKLVCHLKVNEGDFVYLPAGLLHALKAGNIVYEIQQATDITYRFFDYHRKDNNGNERELQLEQAIDCLSYDKDMMKTKVNKKVIKDKNWNKTTYISNHSFTVTKLEVLDKCNFSDNNYQLATVVKGNGKVDNQIISVGDNFLIPINNKVEFIGNMTIMMTTK